MTELPPTLAAAMVAFHAALGARNPDKSREVKMRLKDGGEVRYEYAELPTTLALVRPLLAAAGISYTQAPVWVLREDRGPAGEVIHWGQWHVRTTLIHASGDCLTSDYPMFVAENRNAAQGFGSADTYARRYALMDLLGLAADTDDDGQGGADAPAAAPTRQRAPAKPEKPRPKPSPSDSEVIQPAPTPSPAHSEIWRTHAKSWCAKLREQSGLTYAEVADWREQALGLPRPSALATREDLAAALDQIGDGVEVREWQARVAADGGGE